MPSRGRCRGGGDRRRKTGDIRRRIAESAEFAEKKGGRELQNENEVVKSSKGRHNRGRTDALVCPQVHRSGTASRRGDPTGRPSLMPFPRKRESRCPLRERVRERGKTRTLATWSTSFSLRLSVMSCAIIVPCPVSRESFLQSPQPFSVSFGPQSR